MILCTKLLFILRCALRKESLSGSEVILLLLQRENS